MTLRQLHVFKQWHLSHHHRHALELAICDAVLALWLTGWVLLPLMTLLGEWPWLPGSLLLTLVPAGYLGLRHRLHRAGRLRCDWLDAVREARGR
ncbi:MAG: hypothetical protein AB9M60_00825 [Leptothrix sp. (in: b-proteobacteria)]